MWDLVGQLESTTGLDARWERGLDLVGVFVFALSGGLLAVRKGFELVGVTALSVVTALGGGLIRDVVLGDTPPVAFRNVWYLVVPLGAAVVVFVGHHLLEDRLSRPVLAFDAMGLGLFCVTGAAKAADADVSAVGAVVIGVIAATGGGILRDVLANEEPQLFQKDSRLYAIPAALGATVIVVAWRNDADGPALAVGAAVGVTAFRLAALRWGWRAPMPRS